MSGAVHIASHHQTPGAVMVGEPFVLLVIFGIRLLTGQVRIPAETVSRRIFPMGAGSQVLAGRGAGPEDQ